MRDPFVSFQGVRRETGKEETATAAVLSAVYEEDFLGFSYGFRPGRGAHDALDALAVGITRTKVNWILDADIRSFFDAVNQEWLLRFLNHRIGDPRILRLIQKWLRAGVLEDGVVNVSETGTGQGGPVPRSPRPPPFAPPAPRTTARNPDERL